MGTQRTAMVCRRPGGMTTAMNTFVAAQQHMQTRTQMKSATRPSQDRSKDKLIAFDDSELSDWVLALGEERSGRFLCALAEAVMKADPEEYSVIRPALVNLKRKYAEARPEPEEFADAITSRKGRSRILLCERGEP
jgi:hypothetical protein